MGNPNAINSNRKYAIYHGWKLQIRIPESLRDAVDATRGEQSRTSFVVDALRAYVDSEK